ncbi:GTPase IMAP family member 7 [Patella vulgata]|uniref:GTPase IMAP family member 7 n=1 Tax=Patella vulgata TaxID=6465 RepID=UPI00217FE656|nr:GTPase IMAP family member 7 [Patella vulgata]
MLMYQLVILCLTVLAKTYGVLYKDQDEVRVVLVGKTGVGKSSLGNALLKMELFEAHGGFKSVTEKSTRASAEVDFPGFGKKNLVVVDTPGLFCTKNANDVTAEEIGRCVEMSLPGPHVFIYVISGSERFTDEDFNTFVQLQERFGGDVFRHLVVVFTKEKPSEFTDELEDILEKCDKRYAYINTKTPQGRPTKEVDEILELILKTVQMNHGKHYTSFMYKQAAKRREEEKIRKAQMEEQQRELEYVRRRNAEIEEAKRPSKLSSYVLMGLGGAGAMLTGGIPGIVSAAAGLTGLADFTGLVDWCSKYIY